MTETFTQRPTVTTSAIYRVRLEPASTAPTPDLMTALSASLAERNTATVDELVDWAVAQDFGPEGAERIREEAWGDRRSD